MLKGWVWDVTGEFFYSVTRCCRRFKDHHTSDNTVMATFLGLIAFYKMQYHNKMLVFKKILRLECL